MPAVRRGAPDGFGRRARRSTTSTGCRSRAGTSRQPTAARASAAIRGRPQRRVFPCWPAAAARSSARIARTGSWPATARGRWRTSWTSSSAVRAPPAARTLIFRDPLFSQERDRCLSCATDRARGLALRFECETRLDRLDSGLLKRLHAAGLRAMSFGVESMSPTTLKKVGRRPIPPSAPAPDDRGVPRARDRHRGASTCSGSPTTPGNRSPPRSILDLAGLDPRPVQAPHALPGHAALEAMEPQVIETDWEKFDGFTPTFTHPSLTRRAQFLLGERLHAVLHAPVVPHELPAPRW